MRKLLLFLAIMPLGILAQVNSYTVSNLPNVKANFSSLQGAIDSVPGGSTLFVFPSPIDYGNITLHKKMILYGTGYMLDQNTAPFTSPNQIGVHLTSATFLPGSDNSLIEGFQVIGLIPNGQNVYRFNLDSVSNITIRKCLTDIWTTFPAGNVSLLTGATNNCTFSQCYFNLTNLESPTHSGGSFYYEYGGGSSNLNFTNNIIDGRGGAMLLGAANSKFGNINFTYNTFYVALNGTNFYNLNYSNNIIINSDLTHSGSPSGNGMMGAAFNNITNDTSLFQPKSGNLTGLKADSILVTSILGYHSWDQQFQVLPTSVAKIFSTEGAEVGAYGGSNPYVLSGIPNLPSIYAVTISPDSSKRGNILIRIKGKSSY